MRRIVLALAFAGLALAQVPNAWETSGRSNCRAWKATNTNFHLGLVTGYSEVWEAIQHFRAEGVPDIGRSTYGEITEGITTVCSRPENAQLLVLQAMVLFLQKAAGASESDIEALAARFRKDNAKGAK
jgi:hypothetical protein